MQVAVSATSQPQGSVPGPLLFAVYCSPVADIIASHGVRCHQYADDTQLHLAMRVDNTAAGLSILATCTTVVKQWYMQNGLQLNPDKSKAFFMGTATQLRAVSSLTSVTVVDVDLPVADSMRVLGVTLDSRLTFDNHASAVARSCNHHARAICHIRHLLTLNLAQTLACSLILESITATLCCTALHSAPFRSSSESRTTRRVSFYKRLGDQTSTRCFRRCTGCLLNSASTISWPCWRSRFSRPHLRSIWTSTSRYAPAHATLDRHLSHCCACHFDGHHLSDDRSALPHLWLVTHCHLLC